MPSLSDHVRRDAEHAARQEIAIVLEKFKRRVYADAKSHIEAANPAEVGDGTALGREAAAKGLANYLDAGEPQPAIEAASPSDTLA